MSDMYREIQENLFEYFENVDNKMLSDLIEVFVYDNGTNSEKVSAFAEKFLKDNGLLQAHTHYTYDKENPKRYFNKLTLSESSILEQVKTGLLSVAYNRFKLEVSKPKATPLATKLNRGEKNDLINIIDYCERHNNDLIADEDTTRSMFDEDEANDLIAERKRLAKLFTKVLTILK